MKLEEKQLKKLAQLIAYSDRYEINIQHWPQQTAVYISKGGIDLTDYGGDFDHAIGSSLDYLKRINKQLKTN